MVVFHLFFVGLPEGNSHGNARILGWFPQFLMENMIIEKEFMAPNTTWKLAITYNPVFFGNNGDGLVNMVVP